MNHEHDHRPDHRHCQRSQNRIVSPKRASCEHCRCCHAKPSPQTTCSGHTKNQQRCKNSTRCRQKSTAQSPRQITGFSIGCSTEFCTHFDTGQSKIRRVKSQQPSERQNPSGERQACSSSKIQRHGKAQSSASQSKSLCAKSPSGQQHTRPNRPSPIGSRQNRQQEKARCAGQASQGQKGQSGARQFHTAQDRVDAN